MLERSWGKRSEEETGRRGIPNHYTFIFYHIFQIGISTEVPKRLKFEISARQAMDLSLLLGLVSQIKASRRSREWTCWKETYCVVLALNDPYFEATAWMSSSPNICASNWACSELQSPNPSVVWFDWLIQALLFSLGFSCLALNQRSFNPPDSSA